MAPHRFKAFVFDAYGTLFDVASVAAACEALFPGHGALLARHWRDKQLQFTWLRSLMRRHAPFDVVTAQGLQAACDVLGLDARKAIEARLADEYLRLRAFPEVAETLRALAGRPRLILSNGTPRMIGAALDHAALGGLIDEVLSVEAVGIYKPDPRIYALATERLGLPAQEIAFVSSNGWDIAGAASFGLHTIWVNRAGLPAEPLDHGPALVVPDLRGVLTLA